MKDILLNVLMFLDGPLSFGSLLDAVVPAGEFARMPLSDVKLSSDDDDDDDDDSDDGEDDDSDEDEEDSDEDDDDSDDDDEDHVDGEAGGNLNI